ncbi:hypothetical protein XSR1_980005 [Xenorhabdus szentirmaii DSM 16338]|uniref:RHS protein conserved region domain-containing protein n=5 Tax=Xenorhabdus szentirmaii TaxID=290112 RepID=W1J7E9_9GAMM|nr:hypothetical protein XSR1_980005 [Xenorhabdus szentirmaii DSM 16338]
MKAIYHYDALGRRIRKVVTTWPTGTPQQEQTDFVWHSLKLLQERHTNTGKTQTYCYESHESYTPLACIVAKGTVHNYFWYHTDINSAPLEVTDEDGKIAWSGKYDAFGAVNSTTMAYFTDTERSTRNFDQNLRYAGQYFDKETGLHFNTYRYYAPEIGRFISPDPIGLNGGLNIYVYAPNPLSWIDPLGLAKQKKKPEEYPAKTKNAFNEALENIKNGGGVPRLDDYGAPKIYQGREWPKWKGAVEYEVPGLNHKHRILKLDGIDSKGNPYSKYGYSLDHYEKIHSDWERMGRKSC